MKKLGHAYHSSLTPPVAVERPRQRVKIGASVAFVADLGKGLAREFASCDILYTEVAWQKGYERFVERAGGGVDYATYLSSIAALAQASLDGKAPPCILVCGRTALRGLPAPTDRADVNLNTGGRWIAEAVAVAYGCRLPVVTERHKNWQNVDTENLLRALAKKYRRVGDPCCGYGNTGRVFAQAGREFVLADLNAACIGHIAEQVRPRRPR